MKKRYLYLLPALFAWGSCQHAGHHDHTHQHNHSDCEESHNEADEGAIVLTEAQARFIGVRCEEASYRPFQDVIKVGGQLQGTMQNEQVIVSTHTGIIQFTHPMSEGMLVSQGSQLALLSSQQDPAGSPAERARMDYEYAKKEYERNKSLASSQIVSEKELQQSHLQYEHARMAYQHYSGNPTGNGCSINAPIKGYLQKLWVKSGEYVQVGQPICAIGSSNRLRLRAEVPIRYQEKLHRFKDAQFQIPGSENIYRLADRKGKLIAWGQSIEAGSSYLPITFELDGGAGLLPGAYVEVYLLSDSEKQRLVVPRTALTEEEGEYFVYVEEEAWHFHKQRIHIGSDNGQWVEIVSGLEAGQSVVIEGANQVKLAGLSKAIPGHTHQH